MTPCLHITTLGPDTGAPMVLLHGFMGSAASFRTLAEYLPAGIRPVGIDLPGHGKSRFRESPCLGRLRSFRDVAGLILDDLACAGIDRFFLYGYSMGGRVAQQVALLEPERVRHLVVESAAFGIAGPADRKTRYANDRRMLDGIRRPADLDAFLAKWHAMDLFCTLSDEHKQRLTATKRACDVSELKQAMALLSVGNQPYLLPLLSAAPFPVTLFYGREDAKYMAIAHGAGKVLPNARFVFFPNASHDIHTQYPEALALALSSSIGLARF